MGYRVPSNELHVLLAIMVTLLPLVNGKNPPRG
jgi:hypothetical protein